MSSKVSDSDRVIQSKWPVGGEGRLKPTTCLDLLQINVRHASSQLIEMGLIRYFYLFYHQLFLNSHSYNRFRRTQQLNLVGVSFQQWTWTTMNIVFTQQYNGLKLVNNRSTLYSIVFKTILNLYQQYCCKTRNINYWAIQEPFSVVWLNFETKVHVKINIKTHV